MWKLLYQSVRGTSHRRSGKPCQDRCLCRVIRTGTEAVLVIACADGAGSADLSAVGASRACRTIISVIASALKGDHMRHVLRRHETPVEVVGQHEHNVRALDRTSC